MSRFVLAPDAERDLDEIWEYIAADNLEAADRFLDRIEQNILELALTPRMGHTRTDLAKDRKVLFWPVGNYLILYRPRRNPIEIVAIVHAKRDIPAFVRRRGI